MKHLLRILEQRKINKKCKALVKRWSQLSTGRIVRLKVVYK